MAKEYLGDAVYVNNDGYHAVLTTEDGISITNTIYLDPGVVTNLVKYFVKNYEGIERIIKDQC